MDAMDLVGRVEGFIKEEKLLKPGDSVAVAVSGGPDSVALLHILFLLSPVWQWKLLVVHVNHRFRGEESDREADYVRSLSAQLGLPCEVGTIDVPEYIRLSGKNGQEAAREKRYAFLYEAARRNGAEAVALAHHADDQAETVLMRVLRGTGISGLTGIPTRRPLKKMELIRPLIRITKQELAQFCRDRGLSYCFDSSNAERKYTRNRLRLEVMPVLAGYNPRIVESLTRLAEVAGVEDDYLEGQAKEAFTRLVTVETGEMHFSREDFTGLHLALQRRLIKLILNYLAGENGSLDFIRMELIRKAVLQNKTTTLTLDVSERLVMVREYDRIRLTERREPRVLSII
ncbi:tRNA lysidine(34) synthetase TilS [Paenibacillus sp. CC-CFT747]|nr:tRNA lysidine(34) synthetase TilS [Paenibacillus sp. CC-CFT747]